MIIDFLSHLGASVRSGLAGLGAAARTFAELMAASGTALRRPRLVTDQVETTDPRSGVRKSVAELFEHVQTAGVVQEC